MSRIALVGAAAVHFLLILAVSCRETVWLAARGLTLLPPSIKKVSKAVEATASGFSEHNIEHSHSVRQALRTYLHLAGIESGYGFFAPNVPDSYHLVFELHYPDERVEYESAGVESGESTLRFASLMDYVGRTSSALEREILIKLLAHAVWREHPDAVKVRAILGTIALPAPAEFRQTKTASYQFLSAYEFVLRKTQSESETPWP